MCDPRTMKYHRILASSSFWILRNSLHPLGANIKLNLQKRINNLQKFWGNGRRIQVATICFHSDSIISKVMHSIGSILYLIHSGSSPKVGAVTVSVSYNMGSSPKVGAVTVSVSYNMLSL